MPNNKAENRKQHTLHGLKVSFGLPFSLRAFLTLPSGHGRLINEDLVPSPPDRWTWNTWSFLAYWWSEAWNVSTWSVGATMIALGLTVEQAVLTVLLANITCAVFIVLNGCAASHYHIGFPVIARSVFGMHGSYFFVVIRAILGVIWGGVQLYFEGQFISIMLRCVFPSWARLPNNIPSSQGIDTQTMIGFFLAFCFTLPLMFIHTTKIRHLFAVKGIVVPLACICIVIWATSANNGVSAAGLTSRRQSMSSVAFAFAVIGQYNAQIGSQAAIIITVPDFARYAKTPRDQLLGQALGLPLSTLCAAFGCITTAACLNMYGKAYWNPYDLFNGILDDSYNPRSRAGIFFAAAAFAFAITGTSIAVNITRKIERLGPELTRAFAADVTCLLPRYINIVRGQILCLVIAFAITPWRILTSATTFLTFLSGYSIFQGNVTAIMIIDYFFVRRGNLDIEALYDPSHAGKYFYTWGVNWRAVVAFVGGFAVPLPGFIGSFGHPVANIATYIYHMGWIASTVVGGTLYLILCVLFKVPGQDDCRRPFGTLISRPWTLPDGSSRQPRPTGKASRQSSVSSNESSA